MIPGYYLLDRSALLRRSSRWMRGMGLLRVVGAVALTATVLAADRRPNILFIMVRASAPCASSSRAASDASAWPCSLTRRVSLNHCLSVSLRAVR